jgi:CheY-like chemotaxis protein
MKRSGILRRIFPKVTLYTAHDGMEGLDIFKEHEPDIMLTDLVLPKINGVELAEAVRSIILAVSWARKPVARIFRQGLELL